MNAIAAERRQVVRGRPWRALGADVLRAATAAMHLVVMGIAVFSVAANRFEVWIDLRMLGRWAVVVEVAWAMSVLLVAFCAGPWVAGWVKHPRWVQQGASGVWARRFLWGTYGVLICLVANCVYYLHMYSLRQTDAMVPMPAVAGAILTLWVLLTREWLRRRGKMTATAASSRWMQLGMIALGAAVTAGIGGMLFVMAYSRPPGEVVDLAVVLGGNVRPDGTASVLLTDRTRVAIDLYKRGLARHILLSGYHLQPVDEGLPERNELVAMKRVCKEAGIPDEAISIDPVGINTRSTAFNTAAFMKEHAYKSVVACSTDFHLFRTAMSFREAGVMAFTLPAQPTAWRCASLHDTLREMVGIVVYSLDPRYHVPKVLAMQMKSPRVVVEKSAGRLEVYDGGSLMKEYACISGGTRGDKAVEGDRKTPEGRFRIVYKNPESKFHLSLGLDYPNQEDAERGLAAGLITRDQYAQILAALRTDLSQAENQKKLWYTPLGGEIFIHGRGEGREGTAGCVAMSNKDIEELYAVLPVGTEVEIKP